MTEILQIEGFSEINMMECTVPICPNCNYTHDEITMNPEFDCPRCETTFDAGSNSGTKNLEYLDCASCDGGEFLYTIHEETKVIDCPSCENIIALQNWGEFFDPMSTLTAACDSREYFLPENEIEWLATRLLTHIAYNDDISFRGFDKSQFNYLVKCVNGLPCGYIAWNDHADLGKPLLNQIWISDDFRRHGYASDLTEEWCKRCVSGEKFYIESPSKSGQGLFNSLSTDDGKIFGKKWDTYVPSNRIMRD